MKNPTGFRPICLVFAGALLSHGAYLAAQSAVAVADAPTGEIRRGLDAVSSGEYELAATHFEAATKLEPSNPQAFLYLGAVYAAEVVPGLDDEKNRLKAVQASGALLTVLKLRPEDGLALRELASVYFDTRQEDKARQILLRIVRAAPNDFEAEYTIGALDYFVAYRTARKRLEAAKVEFVGGDYPKAPLSVCREIASLNGKVIDEALQHLNRAIALNMDYTAAFEYLSLVYKLRAGTQCSSAKDRATDLGWARKYTHQALRLRENPHPAESPQPASTLTLPKLLAPGSPPPPPPPPPPSPGSE
jgi:tetratricopeptide (TPR) repeat protein